MQAPTVNSRRGSDERRNACGIGGGGPKESPLPQRARQGSFATQGAGPPVRAGTFMTGREQPGVPSNLTFASFQMPNDPMATGMPQKSVTMVVNRDAAIGKGFAEQMKRGLAQAGRKNEEQRVVPAPQEDFGFVSTLQRGFEGLMGHVASSKEEVLRRKGRQTAADYEAVPSDDMDLQVQNFARKLRKEHAEVLMIYRIKEGEYDIDGHHVFLEWATVEASQKGEGGKPPSGIPKRELFVRDVDFPSRPPEALRFYLGHVASIAHDMTKGGSALCKVPDFARMSFPDAGRGGPSLRNASENDRFEAMLMASEQARKREEAATAWMQSHQHSGSWYERQPIPEQAEFESAQSHYISRPPPRRPGNGIPRDGRPRAPPLGNHRRQRHGMHARA